MYEQPRNLSIAAVLAAAGGVIALAAAFLALGSGEKNAIVNIGALLLAAVMFFGIAGGISVRGQWDWMTTMLMIFICASVVLAAYLLGSVSKEFGLTLTAIALAVAGLTSTKRAEAWLD